jgi:hypothetical protein
MRNYRRSEGAIVGAEETVERLADELLANSDAIRPGIPI